MMEEGPGLSLDSSTLGQAGLRCMRKGAEEARENKPGSSGLCSVPALAALDAQVPVNCNKQTLPPQVAFGQCFSTTKEKLTKMLPVFSTSLPLSSFSSLLPPLPHLLFEVLGVEPRLTSCYAVASH